MSHHTNRRPLRNTGEEPKVSVTYTKGLIWLNQHSCDAGDLLGSAVVLLGHLFDKTAEEVLADLREIMMPETNRG